MDNKIPCNQDLSLSLETDLKATHSELTWNDLDLNPTKKFFDLEDSEEVSLTFEAYCPASSNPQNINFENLATSQTYMITHPFKSYVASKWAYALRLDVLAVPRKLKRLLSILGILKQIEISFDTECFLDNTFIDKDDNYNYNFAPVNEYASKKAKWLVEYYLQFYWNYENQLLENTSHKHVLEVLGKA